MNENILGIKFVPQLSFLDKLSENASMTDEQIIEKSSTGYGIDVVQVMDMMLTRNICKSSLDEFNDTLYKSSELK